MEQFLNNLWAALADLATSVGLKLVYAALILIIGLKLAKFFCKKFGKSRLLERMDVSVGKFLLSTLKIVLNCLVIITAALVLGVPATTFVTILGSAGLAVGLALQGSLSNLAGSIMILIFKPFRVGDYIEGNGVSGTVEEINFFYTVLTTPDNKRITCPNGTMSNAVVIDYSTNATRRVDFSLTVAYGTDVEKVRSLLLETAGTCKLLLNDPAPVAYFTGHGESALNFSLRVWCATADYWTVFFELQNTINDAFVREGIEIPFPQMDVHVKDK